MFRKTTKILAVALTVSACGGAAETVDKQSNQQPLAGDQAAAVPEADQPTGAPKAETKPEASQDPPAPTPPACDRDALNKELSGRLIDSALADHEHFRCLCDDQGYPLVGNINAKGTTASQLCGALKEKGLL